MSEAPKNPESGQSPPRPSNPNLRTFSAARQAPLNAERGQPTDVKSALKAGAENTALNAVAILKETWADFRSSDRFFKYKAGIIAAWIAISVVSFVVANPGSKRVTNEIGAKLVVNRVTNDAVYSIYNESQDVWEDVKVVLNGEFEDTAPSVEPGLPLVLDPKGFKGKNGRRPLLPLKVIDLEIDTSEGRAVLMQHGKLIE